MEHCLEKGLGNASPHVGKEAPCKFLSKFDPLNSNKLVKMNKLIGAFALLFLSIQGVAQAPDTYSSSDIFLQIKKLQVLGSVLYIAAHPDDENTRLLAYFSKEKQYRTGYLSLTRGDGGQNLIGDEQGIELGLIRTQELLAARRIDGAEQFFSTAIDFGFSKNAEEALSTWDHDKILGNVVWVIRRFKPDIIITRFPGDARAGHGHHTASALLANEAFAAAADPNKYSSQFKYGVSPWQAKRILWNSFNFGGNNTTSPDQFTLDIGGFSPLLGKSYGEIASESRSQHKSQGFGVSRQRGHATEYFALTGGQPVQDSLMHGITTSWLRIPGGQAIQLAIDSILAHYRFEHPEESVASLVALYNQLAAMPQGYWVSKKMEEVKTIIAACSGLFMEAVTNTEFAVRGDTLPVVFFLNKRNTNPVTLLDIQSGSFDTSLGGSPLPHNTNISFTHAFEVPANQPLSQPYWLVNTPQKGSFAVNDQLLIGKAENDAPYQAVFSYSIYGTTFQYTVPVQYKYTDAVKGEIYEPLVVVDPFSVSAAPGIALVNVHPEEGNAPNPVVKFTLKSYTTVPGLPVTLQAVQNDQVVFTKDTVINAEVGKEYSFTTTLNKLVDTKKSSNIATVFKVKANGKAAGSYHAFLRSIHYDHIPDMHYTLHDDIQVVTAEINTRGRLVGYIAGAGDKVPQALEQMGYEVHLLGEQDITPAGLARFDAIIAGVRAYNLHHWLPAKYDVLMNYIKQGGNYIVQYNQRNLVTTNIGPYPFTISSTRVTDEVAAVRFAMPDAPLLNYPNKIGAKDFDDWIQERSTYHAQTTDAHYSAPLGMHDPNEAENTGSLITAAYGKGNFIYAGLVFFRQLPAGVPGAYRLMANLIALPKNK